MCQLAGQLAGTYDWIRMHCCILASFYAKFTLMYCTCRYTYRVGGFIQPEAETRNIRCASELVTGALTIPWFTCGAQQLSSMLVTGASTATHFSNLPMSDIVVGYVRLLQL